MSQKHLIILQFLIVLEPKRLNFSALSFLVHSFLQMKLKKTKNYLYWTLYNIAGADFRAETKKMLFLVGAHSLSGRHTSLFLHAL